MVGEYQALYIFGEAALEEYPILYWFGCICFLTGSFI